MKKKNLLTTIMAAVMAVVIINTVSGCGENSSQTAASATSGQSTSRTESGTTQKTETKSKVSNTPGPTSAAQSASSTKTSQENTKNSTSFKLYITSKDGVNVRQEPSSGADVLGVGDYGSSYICEGTVMGEDGSSWYKISYLGKTGYVSTAFASKNEPSGSSSGNQDNSSDMAGSNSENTAEDNSEDQDGEVYLNLRTIYLTSADGTVVAIKEQTNGDYAYRDDSGVGYIAIDEDTQWQDQYGNTYSVLNDDTHRFGIEMEQHTITASDGTSVTVTEKADGEYHYRDENGTGYTDNGDGTWTDENGNSYTE